MNCQRFEGVVSELARGQMMAAQQRGEALAHSDACEDCATRLRDEEMLTGGLRALATQMAPLAAPGEVETKLLEAFRVRQVIAPVVKTQSSSRYWLVAVAAVLLLAISVVVIRWRNERVNGQVDVVGNNHRAQTQAGPRDTREVKKNPEKEPAKAVEYRVANVPVRPAVRRAARPAALRRPENARIANHVTREIATDFIPLSYMNAASLQDGGQIVRVELPRSALATFGLPVNMDRYNEKVKADVLLGVDGLAHAIRFVQ